MAFLWWVSAGIVEILAACLYWRQAWREGVEEFGLRTLVTGAIVASVMFGPFAVPAAFLLGSHGERR